MKVDMIKLDMPAQVKISQWTPASNRAWAVGQLLNVTVIGTIDHNSSLLEIETETVVATGSPPLPTGSRFSARIVSLQPLPLLEPILSEGGLFARGEPNSRVQVVGLRTLLPQQVEFAPALRAIEERTRTVERVAQDRDLPALIHATKALFAEIPALTALTTPLKLTQAVAQNGHGLEAGLARCVADPTVLPPIADRKWQILSLLRQAECFLPVSRFRPLSESAPATPQARLPLPNGSPLPRDPAPRAEPEPDAVTDWDSTLSAFSTALKETLEGIAARITTRQLQMIEAASLGQVFGLFELPVRIGGDPDVLQLQYSREGEHGGPRDAERHSLLIMVPLAGTCELRVRLTLRAEQLSIVAWADDEAIRGQLYQRRDELQARLAAVGLSVDKIIVAPVDGPSDAAHLPQGLIDTAI